VLNFEIGIAVRYVKRVLSVIGASVVVVGISPAHPASGSAQQVVDAQALTADSLAATLAGAGVEILGATMSGSPKALGVFSGLGELGVGAGVVLSTGRVVDLVGVGPTTVSTSLGTPGDAQLAAEVTHQQTSDAAVLEFDFRPHADEVSFTYVFASEEYLYWVGKFNDSFAFFINGVNCALVGSDPVSVNTVNATVRPELFVDNVTAPSYGTTFNGFTKPLTCQAAVAKGEVNHAKLVIADTRDRILDSLVLISAGSIRSNTPPVAADLARTLEQGTSVDLVYPGQDPDGDALTYHVVSAPSHGTLVTGPAGAMYTAPSDYVGTDSFTYTVSDGVDVSPPYTVTLTIAGAVLPPQPVPSVPDLAYTIHQGDSLPIAFASFPEAPNADTVFDVVEHPAHGTLSGSGGARVYQSPADFAGSTVFRYTARRGDVTSAPGTVTITILARPVGAAGSMDPPRPSSVRPVSASTTLADTGTIAGTVQAAGAIAVLTVVLGAVLTVRAARRRSRRPSPDLT